VRAILYKIIAVPVFLICSGQLTAQNNIPANLAAERDSLIRLIAKAPDDTAKANTYIQLLANYRGAYSGSKTEDSITYFRTLAAAGTLCKKLNYLTGLGNCLLAEARIYNIHRNREKTIELIQKAIIVYATANDRSAQADAWQYRALITPVDDSLQKAQFLDSALRMTREAGDVIKEARILKDIADFHLNQHKYELSIQELLSLLEFQKKNGDKRLHYTTDLLVPNFLSIGNLKEALRYAIATIDYCRKVNDTSRIFTFYQRLAQIYFDLNNHEKSAMYYKKGFDSYTHGRWDPENSMARQFVTNIVTALIAGSKFDEAQLYLDRYMSSVPEGDLEATDNVNALYSDLYLFKKDYPKAEKYFLKRLQYYARLPHNKEVEGVFFIRGAGIYYGLKQYEKVKFYSDTAYKLGKAVNSIFILALANEAYYKLDSIKGNYASAFWHLQEFMRYADLQEDEMLDKQLTEMAVQYETDQKNSELLLLNTQAKLQQETIQQGNTLRNFMIGGSVLLLLLLVLIFNRYRVKQRANTLLQEKQEEINRQNQTLEKMVQEEKMITTEKDRLLQEKEWLMKEINHRVKNNLQVVMSLLNTQSAYLKDEAALTAIEESRHRVHAISLIHRKLYQSDRQMTRIDMATYIKEVAEYLTESLDTQNRIKLGLFIDPIDLDVTQAVPTGLIINEAVTNAVKYAFPASRKGQINISMYKKVKGPVELTIQDNGIGLPPDFDWRKTESLGMSLMQGLCKQLDGQFDIRQENGLTITIEFEPAKSLNQ
jgi:two-component sensor histidine kinase